MGRARGMWGWGRHTIAVWPGYANEFCISVPCLCACPRSHRSRLVTAEHIRRRDGRPSNPSKYWKLEADQPSRTALHGARKSVNLPLRVGQSSGSVVNVCTFTGTSRWHWHPRVRKGVSNKRKYNNNIAIHQIDKFTSNQWRTLNDDA